MGSYSGVSAGVPWSLKSPESTTAATWNWAMSDVMTENASGLSWMSETHRTAVVSADGAAVGSVEATSYSLETLVTSLASSARYAVNRASMSWTSPMAAGALARMPENFG